MLRTRTAPALAATLAAVCFLAGSPARAQTPVSPNVEYAELALEGERDLITGAMHCTATYKSVRSQTLTQESNGRFTIKVTYNFENVFGQSFHSGLVFKFSKGGRLYDVANGERDAWWAPFVGSEVVARVKKAVVNRSILALFSSGQVRNGVIAQVNARLDAIRPK
jgi:hypothetical protein